MPGKPIRDVPVETPPPVPAPTGAQPPLPTSKKPGFPSECDCERYTYEEGSPCYTPCKATRGSGGLSDDEWYQKNIVSRPDFYDTGISKAQWIAWRGHWDDSQNGFRSENVDSEGNPIQGVGFEKPVDCPEGTTKFRDNQCLPIGDSRIQASWALEGGGAGGGGGKGAGVAVAPKASTVTKGPRAMGQLPYTGNILQDSMAELFNNRAGIFGTGNAFMSGATPRTPAGQDISGLFLPGGGLWWGGTTDLTSALMPFQQTFAPTPAPAKAPATTQKKQKQNNTNAPAPAPVPMMPLIPTRGGRDRGGPRTKGVLEMALTGLT